jgi:ATP-dependent DNA helicase RecG
MPSAIEHLLQSPESKTLEFKRDLSSPRNFLKTLVAFANTAGGRLVFGVDDQKNVIGIDQPLDEEERLCSLVADAIAPRLVPNIEFVTVEDKTLLTVEVFLSGLRPHYIKVEGLEAGVYIRLGSTNRQADRELIAELRRTAEGISFDELPMPGLSLDDLDLEAAREMFGQERSLGENELHTLKLVTQDQGKLVPTKGAILLFGKERERHFSDAWVQCGRFVGWDKADIFDHAELHDHLPQAVDSIMLFLKKHAMRGADFSEIRRKDVWSIPLGILREVVINALVHADYSQRGAPIRVAFFDDRIEVENPGMLLPGMTVEDMKQGISKIRNHVIARIFRELNLIEQWGSGMPRIFREARELGLPELEIMEIGTRVRVVVHLAEQVQIPSSSSQKTTTDNERLESELESRLESQLGSRLATKILFLLQKEESGKHGLATQLGHKSVSGELHKQVKRMLDLGLIEMTIPEKPNSRLQKYRLTDKGRRLLSE